MFVKPLLLLATASLLSAQTPAPLVLVRHYAEGERLVYQMRATNDAHKYEALATGIVKKDERGVFVEEYAWSKLVWDGESVALPNDFRQTLSLDARKPPAIPDLRAIHPQLVGPVTDLLTFYVDVWLSARIGNLRKAGDHFLFKHGAPNSWADGNNVLLGEDAIDFDMALKSVDDKAQLATLVVRHVPPAKPRIRLPAEWMQTPVADTPNNWVEVAKRDGKFVAAVGKETFEVQITIDLATGRVLKGSIDNPVETSERVCTDAALTSCEAPHARHILRRIQVELVH